MSIVLLRTDRSAAIVRRMESSPEREWLSTERAAKQLGVQTRTVYRLIDVGELPGYRMGRVIRLRAHEVNAFIEAARIQPGSLSARRAP